MGVRGSKFRRLTEAVFSTSGAVNTIAGADIAILKDQARSLPQKKARILLHSDPGQALHEMLITHTRGTYIQPHVNERSAKSFLVLSGEMMVLLYSEDGSIQSHHRLRAAETRGDFMIRLEEPIFHTLIVLTDTVVFLETILGPHQQTRYADFAPRPEEGKAAQEYLVWLEQQVGIVKTPNDKTEVNASQNSD